MQFELDVSGLNFPGLGAHASEFSANEHFGMSDNPFFVHVEMATDWAVVGPSIASVVVVLIVALMSYVVQRNQIRSNLSMHRGEWIKELRKCGSEYIKALYALAIRIEANPKFFDSIERIEMYEKIAQLSSEIEMLLSRDDEEVRAIVSLDNEIMSDLNSLKSGDDCNCIIGKINRLKGLIRKEIEDAWEDIKSDLGIRKNA